MNVEVDLQLNTVRCGKYAARLPSSQAAMLLDQLRKAYPAPVPYADLPVDAAQAKIYLFHVNKNLGGFPFILRTVTKYGLIMVPA